ncbi:hypothetical protein, partial [Beijerinckia sp. L45]|uniref:hypothetical protein n=1 Tax=Beijerinckia sp. L45 TaxID=1641855 RepID=UPI00131BCE6F
MRARLSLTPRELGVWFNLRTHLWMFGELPVALKRLAAIGGIGARSFEKMMPVLQPLFDRDDAGRWRDLDLEEERNTRLDLTPEPRAIQNFGDARRVDPALSEARRRAGQDGARKRWENRGRLQVVGGTHDADRLPSASTEAMANVGADTMANGIANGMANETVLPSGFAAALPSVAMSGASEARSKLASLDSSDVKKIQELASEQA